MLEFFHQKETADEFSYSIFLKAIIVFESENERNSFFDYINRNPIPYRELLAHVDDKELPCFPEIRGMNMDEYKKDYRDALVLQKLLIEYRVAQARAVLSEGENHANP